MVKSRAEFHTVKIKKLGKPVRLDNLDLAKTKRTGRVDLVMFCNVLPKKMKQEMLKRAAKKNLVKLTNTGIILSHLTESEEKWVNKILRARSEKGDILELMSKSEKVDEKTFLEYIQLNKILRTSYRELQNQGVELEYSSATSSYFLKELFGENTASNRKKLINITLRAKGKIMPDKVVEKIIELTRKIKQRQRANAYGHP